MLGCLSRALRASAGNGVLAGAVPRSCCTPLTATPADAALRRALKDRVGYESELRVIWPDGSDPLACSARPGIPRSRWQDRQDGRHRFRHHRAQARHGAHPAPRPRSCAAFRHQLGHCACARRPGARARGLPAGDRDGPLSMRMDRYRRSLGHAACVSRPRTAPTKVSWRSSMRPCCAMALPRTASCARPWTHRRLSSSTMSSTQEWRFRCSQHCGNAAYVRMRILPLVANGDAIGVMGLYLDEPDSSMRRSSIC